MQQKEDFVLLFLKDDDSYSEPKYGIFKWFARRKDNPWAIKVTSNQQTNERKKVLTSGAVEAIEEQNENDDDGDDHEQLQQQQQQEQQKQLTKNSGSKNVRVVLSFVHF